MNVKPNLRNIPQIFSTRNPHLLTLLEQDEEINEIGIYKLCFEFTVGNARAISRDTIRQMHRDEE